MNKIIDQNKKGRNSNNSNILNYGPIKSLREDTKETITESPKVKINSFLKLNPLNQDNQIKLLSKHSSNNINDISNNSSNKNNNSNNKNNNNNNNKKNIIIFEFNNKKNNIIFYKLKEKDYSL